jgi:hypothetical protein
MYPIIIFEWTMKTSKKIINSNSTTDTVVVGILRQDPTNKPPFVFFKLLDESEDESEDGSKLPTPSLTTVTDFKICDSSEWETVQRKFKITKQSILDELELQRQTALDDLDRDREYSQYCEYREYLKTINPRQDIGDTVENPIGIRTQAKKQAVYAKVCAMGGRRKSRLRDREAALMGGGYGLSPPPELASLEDAMSGEWDDFLEMKWTREENAHWHRYHDGSWYRDKN